MRLCCLAVIALLVAVRPVEADPPARHRIMWPVGAPCQGCRPIVKTERRVAATSLAIMPGIFVRGIGSFMVHERRAGKRLLIYGGAGFLAAGAAGALIGISGANPYTTPAVPLVVGGAGMFLTTWLADIFVASGGGARTGAPRTSSPWSVELGTTWLHDAYRERLMPRFAGRAEVGRVELRGSLLTDLGGDGLIGAAETRLRILGEGPTDRTLGRWNRLVDHDDLSKLYVRIGSRLQRDDDDMTTQLVGELEVGGRLDMHRLDEVLDGSFAELSTGVGIVRATYASDERDIDSLLLGRFAWGAYLPRGEAMLYYDHRRDGPAGGIAAYRAAGFVGSVGAAVEHRVTNRWTVRGELQIGNAWLTTLAVGYRGGGR